MLFFALIGVVLGFGLRYLGGVGQVLVWLVVLFQTGWTILTLCIMLGAYRAALKSRTNFKMPYGGLTEYAVVVTYFGSGLMGGYWFNLPWSMRETVVMSVILVLMSGATVVYAKGGVRHRLR